MDNRVQSRAQYLLSFWDVYNELQQSQFEMIRNEELPYGLLRHRALYAFGRLPSFAYYGSYPEEPLSIGQMATLVLQHNWNAFRIRFLHNPQVAPLMANEQMIRKLLMAYYEESFENLTFSVSAARSYFTGVYSCDYLVRFEHPAQMIAIYSDLVNNNRLWRFQVVSPLCEVIPYHFPYAGIPRNYETYIRRVRPQFRYPKEMIVQTEWSNVVDDISMVYFLKDLLPADILESHRPFTGGPFAGSIYRYLIPDRTDEAPFSSSYVFTFEQRYNTLRLTRLHAPPNVKQRAEVVSSQYVTQQRQITEYVLERITLRSLENQGIQFREYEYQLARVPLSEDMEELFQEEAMSKFFIEGAIISRADSFQPVHSHFMNPSQFMIINNVPIIRKPQGYVPGSLVKGRIRQIPMVTLELLGPQELPPHMATESSRGTHPTTPEEDQTAILISDDTPPNEPEPQNQPEQVQDTPMEDQPSNLEGTSAQPQTPEQRGENIQSHAIKEEEGILESENGTPDESTSPRETGINYDRLKKIVSDQIKAHSEGQDRRFQQTLQDFRNALKEDFKQYRKEPINRDELTPHQEALIEGMIQDPSDSTPPRGPTSSQTSQSKKEDIQNTSLELLKKLENDVKDVNKALATVKGTCTVIQAQLPGGEWCSDTELKDPWTLLQNTYGMVRNIRFDNYAEKIIETVTQTGDLCQTIGRDLDIVKKEPKTYLMFEYLAKCMNTVHKNTDHTHKLIEETKTLALEGKSFAQDAGINTNITLEAWDNFERNLQSKEMLKDTVNRLTDQVNKFASSEEKNHSYYRNSVNRLIELIENKLRQHTVETPKEQTPDIGTCIIEIRELLQTHQDEVKQLMKAQPPNTASTPNLGEQKAFSPETRDQGPDQMMFNPEIKAPEVKVDAGIRQLLEINTDQPQPSQGASSIQPSDRLNLGTTRAQTNPDYAALGTQLSGLLQKERTFHTEQTDRLYSQGVTIEQTIEEVTSKMQTVILKSLQETSEEQQGVAKRLRSASNQ